MSEPGPSKWLAVRQLLAEPPKLHRARDFDPNDDPTSDDGLTTWGIQQSFLDLVARVVTPEYLTLETGSGLSTICFAISGSEHICVSPAPKEHNRIRNYCSSHGISTGRVRFIPIASHAALPGLDTGGRKLDFALIDGSHAFPQPVIDYHYVNGNLKVGGFLAVDDLNIPSVGMLHKFLMAEPAYELVEIDGQKTGVYRKVRATDYPNDWTDQKLNSRYPDFSYLSFQVRARERLRAARLKLRAGLGSVPGLRGAYQLLEGLAGKR
jgi:hypothetical protein